MVKTLSLILVLLLLSSCGISMIETVAPPTSSPNIDLPTQPKGKPSVIIEVSPPQPINKVMMISSMGYHWYRVPPEKLWTLRSVTLDVKNFLPNAIHLDKAIVEIAGWAEEVSIDVTLAFKEYQILTIGTTSIEGIKSGNYPLHVSLWSDGKMVCEREDVAKAYWKEKGD